MIHLYTPSKGAQIAIAELSGLSDDLLKALVVQYYALTSQDLPKNRRAQLQIVCLLACLGGIVLESIRGDTDYEAFLKDCKTLAAESDGPPTP